MTSRTVKLVALVALAGIPGCGGGGDSGVNGPPSTPVVTTVEISPGNVSLFMGDTIQLFATIKDQNGSPVTGKRVTWTSEATTVASVDSTGLVIARASGTARIAATVDGKTGAVTLTSTGPGTTGAVTGSATIGTAGGSVQATLPGGGTMNLTVPSGALRTTVPITLEPLVPPPGALASFHLTPAGVQFDKNATLVIKLSAGAKLRPTSTLVFEQGGQRIPVLGVPNLADGTLTISLATLGLSENSASGVSSRTRALPSHSAAGSATGSVYNLALDMLYVDVQVALDQLIAAGTIASAENAQTAWEALTGQGVAPMVGDSRFVPFRNHWTSTVCGAATFAFNALANFNFVSDYRGLERVMVAVIHWKRVALEMNSFLQPISGSVPCASGLPDPNTRIHTRLTTLEPAIRADLNAFAVEPSPRDSSFFADRLKPLIDLGASLAFLGNPADAQIVQDIVREQLVRLRQVGYSRCRSTGQNQELQGRLARNLGVGPLPGLTLADLQDDIELCGMTIQWEMLDSTGLRRDNGALGGGNLAGQKTASASATLTGDGQLKLSSGFLQALLCPAPSSANNEQLEIVAGRNTLSLTRVAVLSPSNQQRYLAVSSLLIGTDTLRSVAGLAPGDSGLVTIVVRRIGGVCSGLFTLTSHSPIATLRLTLKKPTNELYFNDFNAGPVGSEWNTTRLSTSPSGQRFLGTFGNQTISLQLSALPAHTKLKLEFDLYIIGGWNGETDDFVRVATSGQTLLNASFSNKFATPQSFPTGNAVNQAGTGAISTTGLGYPPEIPGQFFGATVYRLSFTVNHTSSAVAFEFSSIVSDGSAEVFGIDNIRVSRVP